MIPQQNAYVIMMEAASKVVYPPKYDLVRRNNKFRLYNDIIQWLQNKKLGWDQGSLPYGNRFVSILTDTMWMLDCHRITLKEQNCAVPDMFDSFIGYNRPKEYKCTVKQLDKESLLNTAQSLFSLLEQVCLYIHLK